MAYCVIAFAGSSAWAGRGQAARRATAKRRARMVRCAIFDDRSGRWEVRRSSCPLSNAPYNRRRNEVKSGQGDQGTQGVESDKGVQAEEAGGDQQERSYQEIRRARLEADR